MSGPAPGGNARSSSATPLVSVLLSSRNGARYLEEALASIAAQDYPSLEIVAVDDGSTDATSEILFRFAARHARTRILRAEGIGLAAALHRAAGEATGEYFARQDDDDRSEAARIGRQIRYLQFHPHVSVLGTAATRIDEAGRRIAPYPVPVEPAAMAAALRRGTPFVHGSVVIRREAYEAAGGYRGAFRAAQDVDLWLRMPGGTGFANLPEALYEWRAHPGGVFARARDAQLFYGAAARAFAEERRADGSDSVVLLGETDTPAAFLTRYPRADRVRRYWGASLVREGRTAEARALLGPALLHARSALEAASWWALSWPIGFLPRARRARAAARAREASRPERGARA